MIKSNLNIHNPDLSIALWENVPGLIHKAFSVNQTNIQQIKRWSDQTETKFHALGEVNKEIEKRLASMDQERHSIKESLEGHNTHLDAIAVRQDVDSNEAVACIGHVLYAFNDFIVQCGRSFGKEMDVERDIDSTPVAAVGDVPDVAASHQEGFENLHVAGRGLHDSLHVVLEGFEELRAWRQAMDADHKRTEATIESLESAASMAKQRMMAWRETLQENSHAVHALSATLSAVQGDVKALQATQVRQEDIDRTVGRTKAELNAALDHTEEYVNTVRNGVELHMTEMNTSVNDLRVWAEERIEEHSSKVAHLLESSLNPVNAYLNELRVKADSLRVDVDKLDLALPKLIIRLDQVQTAIDRAEEERCESDRRFSERLGAMDESAVAQELALAEQGTSIGKRLQDLQDYSDGHFENISAALEGTEEALRSTRESDIPKIAVDIAALEQKIGRWIHANPLPLKISEARIFAIERRLADETDARLKLESMVTSAASPALLPQLRSVSKPHSAPAGVPRFKRTTHGAPEVLPVAAA
jgi:hypothetical protein